MKRPSPVHREIEGLRAFEALAEELTISFEGKTSLAHLMLSGGGSRGAWGAGLLNGWSKATGDPSRPVFDVVTGVSTGAVQCTPAFLGSNFDSMLEAGYTQTRNEDVYGFPWVFIPRNLDALRETLEGYLTPAVLEQVAAAAEAGRKLFVGTVDLESSKFCCWDMTELAIREEYDLYREVVLASSANPMGIWPIELQGVPHVDGGVRLRLFSETVAQATGIAANRAGVSGPRRVYYIVNGKLHKEKKTIPSWNWPAILERSLDIVMKENIYGSLYAAWYRMNGTSIAWDFRGSWIPQEMEGLPKSAEYVPEEMIPLYEAGKTAGEDGPWHEGLPDPDYDCREPA